MTIASLVVKLAAETAEFHREMENVARRVESTGRRITRAGMEISKAISLPILAVGLAAFAAALDDSKRHFGPLFVAFETLKQKVIDLFTAIGKQLTPVFLQLIAGKERFLDWLRSLVDAFARLPPGVQKVIINLLLFLAALGPTIIAIGGLIRAAGAIGSALTLLTGPIGLTVLAIMALAAAALYVVTHWDQVKLQLVLAWTFIEEHVLDAIDGILTGISFLVAAMPILSSAVASVQDDFEAFADNVLARAAVQILKLEHNIALLKHTTTDTGPGVKALVDIFKEWADATADLNTRVQVVGPEFDRAGARAQIYGQVVDKLVKLHVPLDQVLTKDGTTLRQIANAYTDAVRQSSAFQAGVSALSGVYFTAAAAAQAYNNILAKLSHSTTAHMELAARLARQIADMTQTLRAGLAGGLEALAARLGQIFAGMAQGFKGFGAVMGGLLGSMLETLGQTLIAYGLAGVAIKKFVSNPAAALAVGAALVVLGAALAGAAQNSLSAASGGGGGGATASAPAPGGYSGGSQTQGQIYVAMPTGRRTYDWSDPQEVADFKAFIENLAGRNVIFLPQPA